MLPLAEIVHVDELLEVAWASALAGIGITAVYSIAIAGATLFSDSRRDGRSGAAAVFATVTVLAALVCAAAVVFGFLIMTDK